MSYMKDLSAYTSIMAPIAHSIKALEGRAANAADVYIFWLAIAASLRNIFTRDDEIDTELAKKVTAIVNRRYKEFIDGSPTDIYFTAFFLDPRESCHVVRNYANFLRQATINPKYSNGQQRQAALLLYLLCVQGQMKCHTLPRLSAQRNS